MNACTPWYSTTGNFMSTRASRTLLLYVHYTLCTVQNTAVVYTVICRNAVIGHEKRSPEQQPPHTSTTTNIISSELEITVTFKDTERARET